MPTTVNDNMGEWTELGTVQTAKEWLFYPEGAINETIFRLTFSLNWDDWEDRNGYRSFGLLRFNYRSSSGVFDINEPSKIIYPQQNKLLLNLPTPPEFKNMGYLLRVPSIRQKVKSKWENFTYDLNIPWSLKIECQ